jgi:23S rRNA (uridine2552-2'-O)-methyltransferase
VAARAVGASGLVVGVDVTPLGAGPDEPQAVFLEADLCDAGTAALLVDALGGRADVVLSDAAPKLTGVRATDRAREEALLEAIEALLPSILRPGGDLLLKILEGPEAQAALRRLRGRFARAKALRPRASRKGSTERYLLARGFRG